MKLYFYGGAGSVTGANYLLESQGTKILIDCGMQQGAHYVEHQNFEPFAYEPKSITALFVTHAHIDHTGRIPKLYRDGFRGAIYSTPPTKDFSELLLLDSERILDKESSRENLPPLATTEDIEGAMRHWNTVHYHESVNVGPFVATFYNAGHILGSSIIKIVAEGKTIIFSGDLGNYPAPIIQPTEMMDYADYVVMESAYGSRTHEKVEERQELLEDVIEDAVRARGTLVIPAFAMERTQDLLFHLNDLVEHGRIPPVPVFIDSPLAIKLTHVYQKYIKYFDDDARNRMKYGDDIFNFKNLHFTLTTEESKQINTVPAPKIVIAGSGMSNGGRILHHERRYLPDPNSTLLFIGYQARGTLGREILEGARFVRIMGEEIKVHAKIRTISGYSAHADQPRLMDWIKPMRRSIKKLFLVQGEQESADVLMHKIQDEFAVHTIVPKNGEVHVL